MEKYYNLIESKIPDSFGSVVKLKEGKLEVFVGGKDLNDFEITLNNKKDGIEKVSKKYIIKEITKYKADELKEGEFNWNVQYVWVGG